jgi:hypothetical protein
VTHATPEEIERIVALWAGGNDHCGLVADAYRALAAQLAEALKANASLGDELLWLQGHCQNESRIFDEKLEAQLAEAQEGLKMVYASRDACWDKWQAAEAALAKARAELKGAYELLHATEDRLSQEEKP